MKKILILILIILSFRAFAQNDLDDAKIIGSITIGNKEVTSVLNETTGCSHKSNLHTKNLFVVGESVKLDMKSNPNQPRIVKPNLPEVVYVDKCPNENDPYHEKRMEILNLPLDSQGVVFSELSPAFKVGVWKDKWKQVKSLNWTDEQLQWINDVENEVLLVPLFTHNPPQQKWNNYQNNIKPLLEERAVNLFSDVTIIVKLINRLADVSLDEPLQQSGNCNTGDDYCSWTCNGCSCTSCDCSSFWGCGTLWLNSCNGFCSQ
ncbi:MAG: bacteriocin fulvocin C-related protein [Vicingaceae bacterium]|nr:bacteriocin fulvocin C-related protein [Vicingaceae bacterium]